MRTARHDAAGFTLIEVPMVTAIIGVLAVISGNRVMRARMSAHEASAVGSLRSINAGQQAYAGSCAGGAFCHGSRRPCQDAVGVERAVRRP